MASTWSVGRDWEGLLGRQGSKRLSPNMQEKNEQTFLVKERRVVCRREKSPASPRDKQAGELGENGTCPARVRLWETRTPPTLRVGLPPGKVSWGDHLARTPDSHTHLPSNPAVSTLGFILPCACAGTEGYRTQSWSFSVTAKAGGRGQGEKSQRNAHYRARSQLLRAA